MSIDSIAMFRFQFTLWVHNTGDGNGIIGNENFFENLGVAYVAIS